MTLRIRRLRMSLVWSISHLALIGDTPPPDAPLLALGKRGSYKSLFEGARAAPGRPISPNPVKGPALELPWEAHTLNWFWSRYLNAGPDGLQRLSGDFAFFRLVPLRRHESPVRGLSVALGKQHVGTGDDVPGVGVQTEAWFHPHMVSLVVNFNIQGEMSLETAGRACLAVRHERIISGSASSPLRLDELASQKLDRLYMEAVGEANAGPTPMVNPFSVVTVLQGEGIDPQDPIVDGGPVHRFLEAVTQWRENRKGALASGRISSRPVPAGGQITGPLLFGRNRSRAVWEPWRFLPRGDGRSSLSCYHRNLMVSTLQTEALLAFAGLAGRQQTEDGARSKTTRQCEKTVSTSLVAMYSARPSRPDTYSSMNLKHIIDDSPDREAVNSIADWNFLKNRLP